MAISKITTKAITFHRNGNMSVALTDGRIITVPLKWYPRLANAKPAARRNWEHCGAGAGIHWPDVDEDLSIEGLLQGYPSPEYLRSLEKTSSRQKSSTYEARV